MSPKQRNNSSQQTNIKHSGDTLVKFTKIKVYKRIWYSHSSHTEKEELWEHAAEWIGHWTQDQKVRGSIANIYYV